MEEPGSRASGTSTSSTWDFSTETIIPLGSRDWGGWRRDSGVGSIHEAPCLDFLCSFIALGRDFMILFLTDLY